MKRTAKKKEKTIKKKIQKGRNKFMVVIGVLLCLVGSVLIYWNIAYSPIHQKFNKEMNARVTKVVETEKICSRDEIEKLPKCLQEYCTYIGLENTKKYDAYHTYFYDVDFVFDEEKDIRIKMDYDLWTFMDDPYRQAFCKAKMYGIPFEGIDYLEADAFEKEKNESPSSKESMGGMKGYLAKAIRIFDTPVENIRKAALITIMGEGVALNPSILLSKYITYEEIDSNHAKATFSYHGVTGSGIFMFDKDKHVLCFESDERQPDEEHNGQMVSVGWRCEGTDFQRKGNLLLPQRTKAVKIYPDKEVVYFDAQQYDVTYY